MSIRQQTLICFLLVSAATVPAGENDHAENAHTRDALKASGCPAASDYQNVWAKVAERHCLKCHRVTGDASASGFVLRDPMQVPASERSQIVVENCSALTRMAEKVDESGRSRLLVKPVGGMDHGGGEVLGADSTEFKLLRAFVASRQGRSTPDGPLPEMNDADLESFFDGIEMISDQRLWRRITLSLAARLPTDSEMEVIESNGLAAIDLLMDQLMREEAFYQRLMEGFNDILLTLGYNGTGESVLSYDHFQKSRHWYQKHSLDHIPEQERQKARYKLADQYREAMRREPLELLRYIVEQDRPFSEILTADYTMMSPYTARGYGLYEELEDRFENPEDPFEFIPAKLPALTSRNGKVQPTKNGLYPHAGLLSMFQYLRRYPTTETNRNRLRARMYYQHFLGVDIMNLAPRVSDAAAIDAAYEVPTMEAAECVVCHRTIDPVAGLFQDYYNEDGHFGPRKEGWFADMFGPGCESVNLPEEERWRALQWLGERTIEDVRFPVAMAEHVYYVLMGRHVLRPPADIDDPHFAARRRAYLAQRELIERAADRFASGDFNLKLIFKELAVSSHYRADGLTVAFEEPERRAELEDIGLVRMLGPEQIERKIVAVFGKPWGRLRDAYEILYGGIDSQEVTERLTEPSGAIGALQRILANDVACKNVAADFALPADQRRLFPGIELDVVPLEDDQEVESQIRAAIVHLHQQILGRAEQVDNQEVDQTYDLFLGIVKEAKSLERFDPVESYFCKSSGQEGPRDPDPHYTLRAWRAVVTYLLRQPDFLYE